MAAERTCWVEARWLNGLQQVTSAITLQHTQAGPQARRSRAHTQSTQTRVRFSPVPHRQVGSCGGGVSLPTLPNGLTHVTPATAQ